ncbi:CPBP family intramembrane glutamic endopeptidase [Sphingosinicella rhizophila]|uniref:CPBP family intramembrane glutamic endopeptidase n=1 Tax=Sphingosinicella rhizophila TaxID=3050082 RepID=A0ABU3QA70_9SPHN|nr:CPBP family intramembrane glutamic endopeptidase [Sphingosinicella sp. GR2756]MDT9600182.1 CPBP family intramembrane glutamic endopeptidase [Sphingosinicella sp. GR2756]
MTVLFDDWRSRLKHIGWAGAFLAILAAMLFPAILLSAQAGRAISIFEQAGLIAAATAATQLLRRKAIWEVTGRPDSQWLRQLGLGGCLGALLMLAPALILWMGGSVGFRGTGTETDALLGAVLLMAGVAIAEETLFRGILFQRLIDALGPWPAQLIIAALFVLTHLGNPGMTGVTRLWAATNIFLASIMFGLAYLRTRSLALPIGLHFMANTTHGILLGFGVSGEGEPSLLRPSYSSSPDWWTGGQFGLEASLPGLATVAITTILLALIRPGNR